MAITVIILAIMIWIGYMMIHTQGREIATLQRQLSELQQSSLRSNTNINEFMKNQNYINDIVRCRLSKGE